jgi:O-antigen/teichoic acid export membrane protein
LLNFIKKGSKKIGIDGAIAFTILSRVIQAGGGVVTLILIAKYLTKVEQGYYYTFGSILAIQIFFELGLSGIITQFVAHENANLTWNNHISFTGNEESSSRLASLLRFTVKWFGVISIMLFFGLLIAGYFFFGVFGKNDVSVTWQIPWIILSITTSLSLLVSPILAFFEGLGIVKEVAKIRLVQQGIQLSLLLLFFFLGLKLYSSPIAAMIAFIIVPIWILLGSKIKILRFIWGRIGKWHVNYRLEIFPYQWKIALSWVSGYFIFQLFNPVLFATEGAIVAGQMGMTLAVLNSIFALAFSWISTKVPVFSNLIAQKKYDQLDRLFYKTLIQSSILNALGLLAFISLIFVLYFFNIKIVGKNFADRFVPFLPMVFMMIPILLNHIVASWATYMRCHKKEPMLVQSVVMGILCSISTIFIGKYFGLIGITLGYLALNIIGFFWTYNIFINKRKQWQNG